MRGKRSDVRWKRSDVRWKRSDGRGGCAQHSSFFTLHSSFFTLHSSFFILYSSFFILYSSLFTSCKQEDDTIVIQSQRHWVEKTVAVVAPLSDASQKARLERTAQWFLENFREAQLYDTLAISLKLEWYNEQTENLAALSQTLANRDDIMAIIGPFDNDALAAFAPACQQTLKPLITPTATSEEIIRRYAVTANKNDQPFLWALTESDVEMTETLMSTYAMLCQARMIQYSTDAHLLAPANSYGQTFTYWAPFFAENYDIDLKDNVQYSSLEELFDYIHAIVFANNSDPGQDFLSGSFTVLESVKQLFDVASYRRKIIFERLNMSAYYNVPYDDPSLDELWQIFEGSYSTWFALNCLCEEKIEELGERAYSILQGYRGFSPYADPTTGFELSYANRFVTRPLFAECKFYDALLLAAFAACYMEHNQHPSPNTQQATPNSQFNNAIITITTPSSQSQEGQLSGAAWNTTSMEIYLAAMEHGRLFRFKGASGYITFDPETYTTTTHTTYVQWQILDGHIHHRAYIGDTGSNRIGESYAAWQYLYDKNVAEQDFDQQAGETEFIQYPAMTDQYAVLVQGSEGFINYRHQSDVLSVYQLLRRGGFDDNHIILIVDRALAYDEDNPERGIIRATPDGPDLLGGTNAGVGFPHAAIDYDAATLTAADISSILLGEQSSRLPKVLPKDAGQNVLFYWSGHGRTGEFTWREAPNGEGFTGEMMRQTAEQMLTQGHCRKLFVVAEPCYAESVVRPLEGITGVLAMTGASGSEQSWADNWSPKALVWMSDRFSQNFVTLLSENPSSSYRDLFLYCAERTLGSHAKIVNAKHFGNLYALSPREFVKKE